MSRLFFRAVTILFIPFIISYAQSKHSIQVEGGVITHLSSNDGYTANVQFNYKYSEKTTLFAYTGFTHWGSQYYRYFGVKNSWEGLRQNRTMVTKDHTILPFYLGGRFDIKTHGTFTTYAIVEAGYSYFTYEKYDLQRFYDPESGELTSINSYFASNEINNLVGGGVGMGIINKMTDKLGIFFNIKVNTYVNLNDSDYNSSGTYIRYSAGLNFGV